MPIPLSKRTIAYIALLITAATWGIATPVIKATVEYVPPLTFLMIRFWISGLITIPLTIYFLNKYKLGKNRLVHIFVAAFLGQVLAMSLAFTAISKTEAVDAALISSFAPLITTFLGFIVLREIIKRKEIEGVLIAFLGTMVIVFEPIINGHGIFNGGKTAFIGNIIILIAVIFDSIYTIYIKKNISEDKMVSPLMQIIIAFSFATIIFTPLGIAEQYKLYSNKASINLPNCTVGQIDKYIYDAGIQCDSSGCYTKGESGNYLCMFEESKPNFWHVFTNNLRKYLSGNAIFGILYMAIVSGILGYTLYSKGLQQIDAGEASVFYYLQPLFAIPVAMIFLGESISPVYVLGAVIIAIGIYFVEKKN